MVKIIDSKLLLLSWSSNSSCQIDDLYYSLVAKNMGSCLFTTVPHAYHSTGHCNKYLLNK